MKKLLFGALLCSLFGRTMAQENATMAVSPRSPFQKEFGFSVSMGSGNKYVVGTRFDGHGTGTVTLFEGKTAIWSKSGYDYGLPINSAMFGHSVVYDPSNLIVGEPGGGKVYIFSGNNGTFNMDAPLQVLAHKTPSSKFGLKVAVSNEYMLVGSNIGVYIFKKEGPSTVPWVLKDSIKGEGIGQSFAISNAYMVIGQTASYSNTGTFRVYNKEGNGFKYKYNRNGDPTYLPGLASSRPSWATQFYGSAVDIQNEFIIIGDPGASKVEVLKYISWQPSCTKICELVPPAGSHPSGDFGRDRVAIKGNYIAVMDKYYSRNLNDNGNVYLYYSENPWNNVPFVFKNTMRTEHEIIKSQEVTDISLSDDGNILAGLSNSNYPGLTRGGYDKGVVYYGNLSNLTKDSTSAYEPDNDFANAKSIALFEPKRAAIANAGDVDYYKLILTESAFYKIQLYNLVRDYNLDLYNSSNELITSSYSAGNIFESITMTLNPGTYYIKVSGASGASGKELYYLHAIATDVCFEMPGKVNNSPETAPEIDMYPSFYSSIKTVGEVHWYKINSAGSVSITLDNPAADFDIALYDQNMVRKSVSENWYSADEYINVTGLPSGVYYIKVYGYDNATSSQCYRLDFGGQNGAREFSDDASVNDASSNAPAAELSKVKFGVFPNIVKSGESVNLINFGNIASQLLQVIEIGTGRIILQQQISEGSSELKLPALTPGIYIINAGENGKAKLVVE